MSHDAVPADARRYTGFFGLPGEKVGLIPRHFSASVANEDLFPAYQQPVGATAH